MKVLLACVGGYSTSILMKKMNKYCAAQGEDTTVDAMGKNLIEKEWQNYDCILLGPQVSYSLEEIKSIVKIPVAVIPSMDYGMGNAENVMKLVHEITGK